MDVPRYTMPSDDDDKVPATAVNRALLMNAEQIETKFNTLRFAEYALSDELTAEREQKEAALAQLKYMKWLRSTPSQAEIAIAQATLTSSAIES